MIDFCNLGNRDSEAWWRGQGIGALRCDCESCRLFPSLLWSEVCLLLRLPAGIIVFSPPPFLTQPDKLWSGPLSGDRRQFLEQWFHDPLWVIIGTKNRKMTDIWDDARDHNLLSVVCWVGIPQQSVSSSQPSQYPISFREQSRHRPDIGRVVPTRGTILSRWLQCGRKEHEMNMFDERRLEVLQKNKSLPFLNIA